MSRVLRALILPSILISAACVTERPDGGEDASTDEVDAGPVDAGPRDAGSGPDAGAPTACSCDVKFTHPKGTATSCELRGDWKLDAWSQGAVMTAAGENFETTVRLAHRQAVTYKFVLDGTNWVADPANPLKSSDGFGGDNSVKYVDCSATCGELPVSNDWSDAVMYFALVDRFRNGNPANDQPVADVEGPANYQGGDLAGVLEKLKDGYFNTLGVTALWLSSPVEGAHTRGLGDDGHQYSAYHGYWPKELDKVDARIGDMALLKEIVAEAHRRGIRVLLDYVMNHVHETSSVYAAHKDWFWPLDNCVCGQGCSWDDDATKRKCWFTSYLPDFDFRNDAARAYSVDNAIWWAAQTGVDGFRLDAVKHIETRWLTDLRTRLKNEIETNGSHFYLVGETFTGDRGVIKSYVNPNTMLDGQFDFPERINLVEKVLHRAGSMGDLGGFLLDNDRFYGSGALMGTFVGNHDLPRTIHHGENPPQFSDVWDGGRNRGWSNTPGQPGGRDAYERLLAVMTVLYGGPGIPLVYYGDEIGLAGAGDPDNRRFMTWSGTSNHQEFLRSRLARLAAVRRAHPALYKGVRTVRGASANVLTWDMRHVSEQIYVTVNRGDDSAWAEGLPAGTYVDLVENTTVTAPLQVKPRTAQILLPK